MPDLQRLWTWVKEMVKHPVEVSTPFRSSEDLSRHMAKPIDPDSSANIIELGSGEGVITDYIVERMHPDSYLVAVETNEEFCNILEEEYSEREESIEIVKGRAENLSDLYGREDRGKADYVVSSVPLNSFPDSLTRDIVSEAYSVLGSGGLFVQLQYSLGSKEIIEETFDYLEISDEASHIIPTNIYKAERR